ncbi:MAG: hypothetical protein NTW55_06525 [Planctomycetota bacterium]|nr:hypothetical protein [Planctomycetota bacterium]
MMKTSKEHSVKKASPIYNTFGGPIGIVIFIFMIFIGGPLIRLSCSRDYRGPSQKQVKSVVNSLPSDGIYSNPEGSGGSYHQPIDNSFDVEIPSEYKFISTYLVEPGIRWVDFGSGSMSIRCGVFSQGNYEPFTIDPNENSNERSVIIDGVRGKEKVCWSGRKMQFVVITYVKYGRQYTIDGSFPKGTFPKYAKDFLNFVRSHRALPNKE